jgi:hypothetical protein
MTTPGERGGEPVAYNFAVLHLVPHVHVGACIPVGVLVHARVAEYLDARLMTSTDVLRDRAPELDLDLLGRYLQAYAAIARGWAEGGPLALIPPSERFHWLTAPRSDVLQSSPVHEGVCRRLDGLLDRLYAAYVERPAS